MRAAGAARDEAREVTGEEGTRVVLGTALEQLERFLAGTHDGYAVGPNGGLTRHQCAREFGCLTRPDDDDDLVADLGPGAGPGGGGSDPAFEALGWPGPAQGQVFFPRARRRRRARIVLGPRGGGAPVRVSTNRPS